MGSSSSRFASCAESILTGTTKREQWLDRYHAPGGGYEQWRDRYYAPGGGCDRRLERELAEAGEDGITPDAARSKTRFETTAAAAEEKGHKESKKAKRRNEYGWDVFNNEAQYRHYKKQTRRAETEGRAPGEERAGSESEQAPHCAATTEPDSQAFFSWSPRHSLCDSQAQRVHRPKTRIFEEERTFFQEAGDCSIF